MLSNIGDGVIGEGDGDVGDGVVGDGFGDVDASGVDMKGEVQKNNDNDDDTHIPGAVGV